MSKAPATLERLSFDPQQAEFWDLVSQRLQLKPAEAEMLARQGLVVINREHPTFAHAYDFLYRQDLPLLVTSDSILYLVHASLDNTTKDLEEQVLMPELTAILAACHAELGRRKNQADGAWIDNYRDVDLYLTVARHLLTARPGDQQVAVKSEMDQRDAAQKALKRIASRVNEDPMLPGTRIYGSQRHVDYSQFVPRGHYTHSEKLRQYFMAMLWLGRADCGWFVTPASPKSGIHVDVRRELRNAVLMVDLLAASGMLARVQTVDETIGHFMGTSDNLTPARLREQMLAAKVTSLTDLANVEKEDALRSQLQQSRAAEQKIASQNFFGARVAPGEQTDAMEKPPGSFQLLGQRFAVDSWVLANVVYDTVKTTNQFRKLRTMPRGLDVMAALGHPRAAELLSDDLQQWKYEPQLQQATDAVRQYMATVQDTSSIYDLWLSSLPMLHADLSNQPGFPQLMRTRPWQLKQLHTELGSWAELRHTGILYVKQSYTRRGECDFPASYVEPYPEFYARIGQLGRQTVKRLEKLEASFASVKRGPEIAVAFEKTSRMKFYWGAVSTAMQRLETMARKELTREPFTTEEVKYLKDTATYKERHFRDSGGVLPGGTERGFTGWYGQMLYPNSEAFLSIKPCVADVHTDGDNGAVLEVGVGRTNFVVAAIDSGADRRLYVGPVYTYYEFKQPVSQRMTDEEFQRKLGSSQPPPRPAWTEAFRVIEKTNE